MTTPSQIDIYRTAALPIEKHGEDAVIEAAMRADAMLDMGDLDGQRVWNAIVRAIEDIQRGPSTKIMPSDGCNGGQFPWRWTSRTISINLDVIWGMSDRCKSFF